MVAITPLKIILVLCLFHICIGEPNNVPLECIKKKFDKFENICDVADQDCLNSFYSITLCLLHSSCYNQNSSNSVNIILFRCQKIVGIVGLIFKPVVLR
jgi:hypothetical protein